MAVIGTTSLREKRTFGHQPDLQQTKYQSRFCLSTKFVMCFNKGQYLLKWFIEIPKCNYLWVFRDFGNLLSSLITFM